MEETSNSQIVDHDVVGGRTGNWFPRALFSNRAKRKPISVSEGGTVELGLVESQAGSNPQNQRTILGLRTRKAKITSTSIEAKADQDHSHKSSKKTKSKRCCSRWSKVAAVPQTCKKWLQRLTIVKWFHKTFASWQANVTASIYLAAVVLCFNLSLIIWASKIDDSDSPGLPILFQGDCKKANNISLAAHAIISIMSTLLLACSNFCMQLLASPTRGDVDRAHRRREWVDIGLQSFRNCWKRHISVGRTSLWLILALSSTPLHLLWNSAIIFSPQAYQYYELTVSEGFVSGLPFSNNTLLSLNDDVDNGNLVSYPEDFYFLQAVLQNSAAYDNLTNLECQRAYAQSFVVNRGDVVVVVESLNPETNVSTIYGAAAGGQGAWPYKWLCPASENSNFNCLADLFQNADQWKFPNYKGPLVKYCLSQKMEQICKVEYARIAGLLVTIANVLKLSCFVGVLLVLKEHAGDPSPKNQLLITTGDAISSFLADPDPHTLGISIVDKRHFDRGMWEFTCFAIVPIAWVNREQCSRFRAIGIRRWLTGNLLANILWLVPLGYLAGNAAHYREDLGIDFTVLRQLGLGKPNGLFLFQSWKEESVPSNQTILNNIILSNLPQLAISLAYFFYNNHFTCMSAAIDYAKFSGTKKQGLRLHNPTPNTKQKSTYILSLPIKHWLILAVTSTLLSWFASQAVFFARVITLDHWLQESTWSMYHVGYSILGIMCFTLVAFIASLINLSFGLRRLSTNIPLASTCSAALSAACHPADSREIDESTGKVTVKQPVIKHEQEEVSWGVERDLVSDQDVDQYHGYCTFTSKETIPPREGWMLG